MNEEEIIKNINKTLEIINSRAFYEYVGDGSVYMTAITDLLDLYKKEKEKNKDLEEKLKIAVAMLTKGTYPEKNKGDNDFDKQFIAIEKIKEIVEKSFDEMLNHSNKFNCGDMQMLENNIMELLEEV